MCFTFASSTLSCSRLESRETPSVAFVSRAFTPCYIVILGGTCSDREVKARPKHSLELALHSTTSSLIKYPQLYSSLRTLR